jgi:hypothetical protein
LRSNLGLHVFGTAVFAFGVITLVWPDYYDWLQLGYLNAPELRLFCYAAAAAQIAGGVAIQFRHTAKAGAATIAAVYGLVAVLSFPQIVAAPGTFSPWGDFFLEFSMALGAAIVYAKLSSIWRPSTLDRIARMLLGLCAISDALYQAFYPKVTADLVPTWIPPGQMFWTVATTMFFGLAGLALLANRNAIVATRLLTLMVALFGIMVWVPSVVSAPHTHFNWTECAENFVIAGTAWIVADLLSDRQNGVAVS